MSSSRKLPSARRPWVAASLTDPVRLVSHARRARRDGANLLEVRADFFPKTLLKPEPLRAVLKTLRKATPLPILLTLRSRGEGGRLHRSVDEQDRLSLIRAAFSEVDAVDVELSSDGLADHVVDEARKRGVWTVLSFHDFKKTPSDRILKGIVRRFRRMKGDVLKVAALPRAAQDVDRLMEFCGRFSGRRAFISMGALGHRSRLAPARWGSCLTYGYVGKSAAPGQASVKALAKAVRGK